MAICIHLSRSYLPPCYMYYPFIPSSSFSVYYIYICDRKYMRNGTTDGIKCFSGLVEIVCHVIDCIHYISRTGSIEFLTESPHWRNASFRVTTYSTREKKCNNPLEKSVPGVEFWCPYTIPNTAYIPS